jgi:hypothetical protein
MEQAGGDKLGARWSLAALGAPEPSWRFVPKNGSPLAPSLDVYT